VLGDRTLTLYTLIFALLGAGAILFFWTIAAVLLLTGNGGIINDLEFNPTERTLFLSYPFVVLVFSLLGLLLYWARRDYLSVMAAGTPVAGTLLFYLGIIFLR
jgi:hypothetical protein